MFKIFFILCLIAPKIALAGHRSESFWNTFWASILVGLFLILGVRICEIVISKLFLSLKTLHKTTKINKKRKTDRNENIKNFMDILRGSFIKNKGIARICIILGILTLSYNLFNFIQFLHTAHDNAIYIEYESFTALNKDIYNKHNDYFSHKRFDVDDSWKKIERCAEIYFYKTHYISPNIIAECSEKENVLTSLNCLAYYNYDDCQKLNKLKEKPIKYYCNGIESLSAKGIKSTGMILTKWFLILFFSYFAPFLIVFFILKPLYKLICWVYSGFREK